LLPSPIPDEKGQPSLTLHRYGVGVDCHSRFFQVCVLIPNDTEIVKIEQKVPALWPELRAAKAWLLDTLSEHNITVSPPELRYTCESTGQYHMPLCLAWRGRPAIINPSDTGHVRRKTDRLDAGKLAQHSLHGLWRESWMAPDEIQELRVLANQRAKLVAERVRLTNRISGDMLRFGHVVGQLGKINGSLVRPLIEDFCTNGSVVQHREYFSDIRIPAGVVRVLDQRWRRVDVLDQEIKLIEDLCLKQVDGLTWRIGAGGTAGGRLLRSNGALRNAARAMLAHAPTCKFAMWVRGHMGRHPRAGKSKAVHALARRVGKALYYCHLKNGPFDDSGYQALLGESSYPHCPVEEMGLSHGVVRLLKTNGLQTSRQVVDAFYSDLGRRPVCGEVTVLAVGAWINSHTNRPQDRTRKAPSPEATGTEHAAED
jgi:hypothetical protein